MNTNYQESNPCCRAIDAAAPALAPYSIWVDAAQRAFALLLRSSESFSTWMTRRRHRRLLDRLSDHTMIDIGLVRVDPGRGWHRLLLSAEAFGRYHHACPPRRIFTNAAQGGG